MCGLCGFIDYQNNSDLSVLTRMTETMNHRGPDDCGNETWEMSGTQVGFGHARLSILDLSTAGHQPMHYEDLSIILNGEMYNFKEVRDELKALGHEFKSDSDTEVILHAHKEWGDDCVQKFIGMFVYVILDRSKNQVTITRDRAGVKPLFYYWKDNTFLFASELKAFHQHPAFDKKLDERAVRMYMDFGYVPSPYSIFKDCFKLAPGHILRFDLEKGSLSIKKYWDVKDYYKMPPLDLPYEEAKSQLEDLLVSAFEYRMVSDVPVGVFLSGGFDSTAVTSILQSRSKEKIRTFTIGFDQGINEAPAAKEIANHLGTQHTEYYCRVDEAKEIIPDLPFHYDEPFADSSAIPTTLVSRLARKEVTVALSADAGDEIFGGYNIYKFFDNHHKQLSKVPCALRKPLAVLAGIVASLIPAGHARFKKRFEIIAGVYNVPFKDSAKTLYRSYYRLPQYLSKKLFLNKVAEPKTVFNNDYSQFQDPMSMAMGIDYEMYLQNDILAKVDRATMSISLEGREPFLDHRIIEFAARLPTEFKYGNKQKQILRDIVYKYIPKEMMERPKSGFSLPIYEWLKKDLKWLVEETLSQESIENSKVFDYGFVKKLKDDFYAGALHDNTIIWKLIQFQAWYIKWMN